MPHSYAPSAMEGRVIPESVRLAEVTVLPLAAAPRRPDGKLANMTLRVLLDTIGGWEGEVADPFGGQHEISLRAWDDLDPDEHVVRLGFSSRSPACRSYDVSWAARRASSSTIMASSTVSP